MARRTKTFSEGLARRFDHAKEYPGEPDNRTLERLLERWEKTKNGFSAPFSKKDAVFKFIESLPRK
jgi:hypothetical protein